MNFSALLGRVDTMALGVLGEVVVYTPSTVGAVPTETPAVFDAAYVKVEVGQPGVSSTGPAVFLRLAGLGSDPSADKGARVTVGGTLADGVVTGGTTYAIREAKPDGQGAALLMLRRV